MRVLIHRTVGAYLGLALLILQAGAQTQAQLTFATPEEAATALLQALKATDREKLLAIFGPGAEAALSSGDAVADRHDREVVQSRCNNPGAGRSFAPIRKNC